MKKEQDAGSQYQLVREARLSGPYATTSEFQRWSRTGVFAAFYGRPNERVRQYVRAPFQFRSYEQLTPSSNSSNIGPNVGDIAGFQLRVCSIYLGSEHDAFSFTSPRGPIRLRRSCAADQL